MISSKISLFFTIFSNLIFLAVFALFGCIISPKVSSEIKNVRDNAPKGVSTSSYSTTPLSISLEPSSSIERFFIRSISSLLISAKSAPRSRKDPLSLCSYSSFKRAKNTICSFASKAFSFKICSQGRAILLSFKREAIIFSNAFICSLALLLSLVFALRA